MPDEGTREGQVTPGIEPRLLTLEDTAIVLNVRVAQVYALVRSGALPALKIGGRGVWRVDRRALDDYIERTQEETSRALERKPFKPSP